MDWQDSSPTLQVDKNQPRKRTPKEARGRVASAWPASGLSGGAVGGLFMDAYHTARRSLRPPYADNDGRLGIAG